MCRMLAAVGPSPATLRDLASRFRVEATRGKVSAVMQPGHHDGWGLVVGGGAGKLAYAGRSALDAATDPEYPRAAQRVDGRAMLVHFRKATAGAKSAENSHPFVADGLAFAHNGTAFGVAPPGESDSRALFARLRAEVAKGASAEDALASLARCVKPADFSSLTTLVTDGARVWGLRKIGAHPQYCPPEACAPDYYTLGHARLPDGTVVVSQEHELLDITGWTPIADGEIVTVEADGRVSVRKA
jgi:predicted glutamine amidotransferase